MRDVRRALRQYRFNDAAGAVYQFLWHEYCDWYLEIAKLQLAGGDAAAQRGTRRTLVRVLEAALRLAHPLMPFITEELWQKLAPLAGKAGETIMLQPYPRSQPEKVDEAALHDMGVLKLWTVAARNLRSEAAAAPGERLQLYRSADPAVADPALFEKAIVALARLSAFEKRDPLPELPSPVAVVGEARIMLHKPVDPAAERERLSKESQRIEGEIDKARAQLARPSFVERAPPAIVEQMRARLAGHEATLTKIKSQLDKL